MRAPTSSGIDRYQTRRTWKVSSLRQSVFERATQQDARLHPIALHRANRDLERIRRFLLRQSAKEPALDDAREARLERGELVHRLIELKEQLGLGVGTHLRVIERDSLAHATTFERQALAGAIDED